MPLPAPAEFSFLSNEKKVLWSSSAERAAAFRVAREKLRLQDGRAAPAGTVLPTGVYTIASGECIRTTQRFMIDDQGVVYAKASTALASGSFGVVTLAETEEGDFYVIKEFNEAEKESDVKPEYDIAQDVKVATTHFVHDHRQVVVLRYLGMDLFHYMQKNATMSWLERLELAIRIVDALSAFHEGRASSTGRGYLHRDVKPENILIDKMGNIHFVDFGLTKLVDTKITRRAGTECYFLGVSDVSQFDARLFDVFALLRTFHMPPQYRNVDGVRDRIPSREVINIFTDEMMAIIPGLRSLRMENYPDFSGVTAGCRPEALLGSIKTKLIEVKNNLMNNSLKQSVECVLTGLTLAEGKTSDPVKLTAIKWLMKEVHGLLPCRAGLDPVHAMSRLLALIGVAEQVFSHHQKRVSTVFGRLYKTDAYSAFAEMAKNVRSVLLVSVDMVEAMSLAHLNYEHFSTMLGRTLSGVALSRVMAAV